jgi:transketolase
MRESIFSYFYEQLEKKECESYKILSNDFGAINLDKIREKYPDAFINCGISEQNQIGVGAGLFKFGIIPIYYSIASFYMRAAEQIKIDIAVPNVPAIFLGVGAGYGYSADGPTHHSIEDIAVFSPYSEINIIVPCSASNAKHYFSSYIEGSFRGAVYFRLDRGSDGGVEINKVGYEVFSNNLECKKLIISMGYLGIKYLKYFKASNEVDVCIVENFECIHTDGFKKMVAKYSHVIIAEEHVPIGGLGSRVLSSLNQISFKIDHLALKTRGRFGYNDRDKLLLRNECNPSDAAKLLGVLV